MKTEISDAGAERAILLVDHGSRVPEAHVQLQRVAVALKDRLPGHYAAVEIAHMEIARPSIEEGIDACVAGGARFVLLIPCFFSKGRHLSQDIPLLVEKAREKHPHVALRIVPGLYEMEAFVDLLFSVAKDSEEST